MQGKVTDIQLDDTNVLRVTFLIGKDSLRTAILKLHPGDAEEFRQYMNTCDQSSFKKKGGWTDPVHKHTDGLWYFCDETWTECLGGYDTEEEANKKILEYVEQL